MYVFVLTYNEEVMFTNMYNDQFVNEHFKPHDIKFIVLDNGNQPLIKEWCEKHNYIHYPTEFNIGSAGGYNWIFKLAYMMDLDNAILMQSDVELSNSEPLFFTETLVDTFGRDFIITWPQEMNNFWLNDESKLEPYAHDAPNLGNFVGFDPKVLKEKDCYFDYNYVVTHIDDIEYKQWMRKHNLMDTLNPAHLLRHNTEQYYKTEESKWYGGISKYFVISSSTFTIKTHHASIGIDHLTKNIVNSHEQWLEINQPYYELVLQNNLTRIPYDHERWTQFGYPKFPVEHELKRFSILHPELIIHHSPYMILH